jgi:hypothetical protein
MSYTTMTSLKEYNQTALFESLNFASLKVVPGTNHIDAQEPRRQPSTNSTDDVSSLRPHLSCNLTRVVK